MTRDNDTRGIFTDPLSNDQLRLHYNRVMQVSVNRSMRKNLNCHQTNHVQANRSREVLLSVQAGAP